MKPHHLQILGLETCKLMNSFSTNLDKITESRCAFWKPINADVGTVPNQFLVGLRVLVVNDDPTCLIILEKMLKSCNYEGT